MPDWKEIRAQYEAGASLRVLAVKHGVSKSLIGKRKFQEKWVENKLKLPPMDSTMDTRPPVHFPISSDVHTIADLLLAQIALHLQNTLEVRDIKSASDALAACAKVKLTFPHEQEKRDGLLIPLDRLSPEARQAIRQILVVDEQTQALAREDAS